MPHFKGLTVHITDQHGEILQEWGIQHLRGQSKVSAYIQSSTDMPFQITIKPDIPFQHPDVPVPNEGSDMDMGLRGSNKSDLHVKYNEPKDAQPVKNKGSKAHGSISENIHSGDTQADPYKMDRALVSYTNDYECDDSYPPPPFHLLASLYVDGRPQYERRLIVFLDPKHEDFHAPDGKVKFKCRCVQAKNGTTKELAWVFQDVGVEGMFSKMSIQGVRDETGRLTEQNENSIAALLNLSGLETEADFRKEELQGVGQILVVFQRVNIGNRWSDRQYRPSHKEDEMEDIKVEGLKSDITHTTGFKHTSTLPSRPTGVVTFWPFVRDEPTYAKFQFFYRNQEVLERFGFPGFPQSAKSQRKTRRELDDEMSNLTPLSIAYPILPIKRKGTTFEEQISGERLDLHPKSKSASQGKYLPSQQKGISSSDSNPFGVFGQATSCTLSHEEMSIGSSHERNQKITPPTAPWISSEGSRKPSNMQLLSANPSSSASAFGSTYTLLNTSPALNRIPKIYRMPNYSSDADDERDSEKDLKSEDDDVLSRENDNTLIQNQDDHSLDVEFGQMAICKKRRPSDEDFEDDYETGKENDPKTEAGSLTTTTETSIVISQINEEPRSHPDLATEALGDKEQTNPNIEGRSRTTRTSKRFKPEVT